MPADNGSGGEGFKESFLEKVAFTLKCDGKSIPAGGNSTCEGSEE